MGLMNFQAAPLEPKQAAVKKPKSSTPTKRIKVNPAEARLYGDQLFKTARDPEKEIVVCFYPFTANLMRVEKREEGARLAINYQFVPPKLEANKDDEDLYENGLNQFLVYHFIEPVPFDGTAVEFKINLDDDNVELFGPFETVIEIRDVVSKILREEYLQNRANKLEELKQQDLEEQLAKERAENEQIELDEQLSAAGLGQNFQSIECKKQESVQEICQETPILSEENEKEIRNVSSSDEIRNPTASFIREVKPLIEIDMKPEIEMETIPLEASKESIVDMQKRLNNIQESVQDHIESTVEEKPKTAAELWMEEFMKGGK